MKRSYWMIGGAIALLLVVGGALTLTAAQAQEQLPFSAQGPEVVTSEAPDEAVCGAGRLRVDVEGSGEATHLGEYEVIRRHCFNPGNNPPTFEEGVFWMTAANGDSLTGEYSGALADVLEVDSEGNPVVIVIDAPYVVTGGTGRFANAEGDGSIEGIFNLKTQEGDFTTEGWISYEASDRSN